MANEPLNEKLYQAAEKTIANGGGTAASPMVVGGNVAAGAADSGNPIKIGGRYNATLPTLTDGLRGDAQLTTRGALFVGISGLNQGLSNGYSSLVSPYTHTSTGGAAPMAVGGYIFNGTTMDMDAKPNITKRIASSAASGNPDFLKASAGNLMMVWGQNGAAITYLQVYNKATAPTIGTDTPILTYPIAALERFSLMLPRGGYYFSTGVAYAFTTDAAGTTGASAAAVIACNIMGS
jgi:hypothetical protein